ncbi:DHA2 family efflux MFS transporter permease subunit [Bosea sp. ZW T0_25]|jgi:DHA2 family multidrug resistance protein|uniref:DHA2 family efflux MFS transporter permease subunit n=2 Tax=Boseaceae TaxID=2831100 RepID=A0ABU3SE34_9HYPH|nr:MULTISPECIES: DHA2 family efflux MFS transporter permease subunit [unclassified Bosea (in: a-proteobacteria)]MDU0343060.1 DHA2 family efflux MFS transporter permease subunit [Bosea sp. ZW T0_25]HEV7337042.1 DHA2 family efflux MFS transporter permease subunit [Bosea sp. (in: a-proteobacteria)]
MATATLAGPAGAPPASDAIPARRIFAFLAMVFGMFMAILDIQIVSASLAEIQAGLSASADEIAWVQTAYLIAEVIMIPLSGYLSRALSTRVFFTIAAAGFTVASVLCAMSSSINEMILWRAVQGFIGGGMIPGVFAAAFTIFPASKRPIVSPLIGLIATLAPTIGPTIGGYLSHAFSWHWLFLINVVPGIGVSIAAWTLIDFDKPDHSLLKRFDWLGLASMAAFLGSLEYVLEEGTRLDWFQSHEIVFFTGLMLVGCVLFFWRALTREDPLVDLYAFRNRNFAFGSLFSFTMGIGLYGLTYLYPVYLGRIRGYDALMIGETMFVTGLAMFLTAPIAGRLSAKLDPRIMMMIGFGGFALGTYLASFVTADWDFHELLIPQILRGCSLMLCMVPINNLALGTLPPQQLKNASGLYNLTRNLGGAVGLALINTFLNSRTDLHIVRLHEAVAAGRQVAEENLAMLTQRFADYGDAAESMALALMNQRAHKQALVMAFGDIFLALTFVFATLVALALFMRKPAQAAPADAGH